MRMATTVQVALAGCDAAVHLSSPDWSGIVRMMRMVSDCVMMADDTAVMTMVGGVVIGSNGASTTRTGRPLVCSVGIVKQRVLVRLRIRVKVVIDLGLQLLGQSCGGCCSGCRGRRKATSDGAGTAAGRRHRLWRWCHGRRNGRLEQWRRCNVAASWRLTDWRNRPTGTGSHGSNRCHNVAAAAGWCRWHR